MLRAPTCSSEQQNELLTKHSENVFVSKIVLFAVSWISRIDRQIVSAGALKSQRSWGEGSPLNNWAWILLYYSPGVKSSPKIWVHIQLLTAPQTLPCEIDQLQTSLSFLFCKNQESNNNRLL